MCSVADIENMTQTPEIIAAHRASNAADRALADALLALTKARLKSKDTAKAELALAKARHAATYANAAFGDAWADKRERDRQRS